MFTPDPAVAFAEIRRVLATGGRFGALTWGGIEHNPWMTCVGMAAMMHGLVSGGPRSVRAGSSRSATPEQATAVRATAADLAAAHTTPSGVELPGLVLMVTGHR